MSKLPSIIPISDLRKDAAELIGGLKSSNDRIIITQRGRAAAVLVSVDEYERSQRETEILRLLARGDKEIAAGKGHNLEAVLSEADSLLEDES